MYSDLIWIGDQTKPNIQITKNKLWSDLSWSDLSKQEQTSLNSSCHLHQKLRALSLQLQPIDKYKRHSRAICYTFAIVFVNCSMFVHCRQKQLQFYSAAHHAHLYGTENPLPGSTLIPFFDCCQLHHHLCRHPASMPIGTGLVRFPSSLCVGWGTCT